MNRFRIALLTLGESGSASTLIALAPRHDTLSAQEGAACAKTITVRCGFSSPAAA
jgi:hypothetical protein